MPRNLDRAWNYVIRRLGNERSTLPFFDDTALDDTGANLLSVTALTSRCPRRWAATINLSTPKGWTTWFAGFCRGWVSKLDLSGESSADRESSS